MLIASVQPVIFATIAYYMFRSGGRQGTLLYASLGAGMMGVWSTTLFALGRDDPVAALARDARARCRLAVNLALVYLPFSLANSFTGAYALAATLIWGRLIFGVPLHFAHPWLFVLAVPTVVLSLGAARPAARVDVRALPQRERDVEPARVPGLDRVGPRLLDGDPPGVDAADLVDPAALLGHHRAAPRRVRRRGWFPLSMALALGLISVVIATFTLRWFEYLARARATLALT